MGACITTRPAMKICQYPKTHQRRRKIIALGVMEVCAPNYPDKGVSAPVPGAFRAGMYVVMHTDERPMMKDAVIKAWYPTDDSHCYSAYMFPVHGIGLELGLTPAIMTLTGKPTGTSKYFSTDVVAIARRIYCRVKF